MLSKAVYCLWFGVSGAEVPDSTEDVRYRLQGELYQILSLPFLTPKSVLASLSPIDFRRAGARVTYTDQLRSCGRLPSALSTAQQIFGGEVTRLAREI